MSTIPAPITIYHSVWAATGQNDAHGNPISGYVSAVARKVQAINQFGRRGSSHEVVDVDYLLRIETLIEISVQDITPYSPKDLIVVGATGLDGSGNPVGGVAYHVEGAPWSNQTGPFPLLNKILGGVVHARRVT